MLVIGARLPPFIENVIRVGRQELQVERDYRREIMLNQIRFESGNLWNESNAVLRSCNKSHTVVG